MSVLRSESEAKGSSQLMGQLIQDLLLNLVNFLIGEGMRCGLVVNPVGERFLARRHLPA